jgi:putative phosphoribosyl transferase
MNWRTALYEDRAAAGRVLAGRLVDQAIQAPIVLAIPNGGIAVGVPISQALCCELRLLVVRKIQIPGSTEAGFGAVAADGTTVLDRALMANLRLDDRQVEAQKERALHSISRRLQHFGSWARLPDLKGMTPIVVDDGLATGSTMEAAVLILRMHEPRRVVAGTPVFAVADAYRHWYDLSDDEVLQLLEGTATSGVTS